MGTAGTGVHTPGERLPKHAPDLRRVVDAMPYVSHTGGQWRFLPGSFGPWTRVWSQFRRWSCNGTLARALTGLPVAAPDAHACAEVTPSMVVIDTHLARGASYGGFTFHDRGGPYGRTKRAKRAKCIVPVDVTGLAVGARRTGLHHENRMTELTLEHLTARGVVGRLGLSWSIVASPHPLPPRWGAATPSRCAVSGGATGSRCSGPSGTPGASRLRTDVLAGLGDSRKSFENTTTSAIDWLQVACVAATLRQLSRAQAPAHALPAAA